MIGLSTYMYTMRLEIGSNCANPRLVATLLGHEGEKSSALALLLGNARRAGCLRRQWQNWISLDLLLSER